MKLTENEKQAIRQGQVVEFHDGDLHCVVLPANLFERIRLPLGETLAPGVVAALVNDTMTDYDIGDPLLDSYQKYRQ